MIKNYLTVTLRNFVRDKNYSLINILGLSIGVTSCIIIYLLISHELRYNQFHSNVKHIYRVVEDSEDASGVDHTSLTPYPFAAAFRNDFPEIPLVTQYHYDRETMMSVGSEKSMIDHVIFADSLFLQIFDFKVLSGNPLTDLSQPGKVFLTESTAKKIFGDKTPTTIKLRNVIEADVVGIIQDPPSHSDIKFTMLVSYPSLTRDYLGLSMDQWGMTIAAETYIVLPETLAKTDIEARLETFVKKYHAQNDVKQAYRLQPLSDVHFNELYNDEAASKSNLVMLGLLGLFILAIACVNFVNLATAMAVKKSKEIGIRKTLGAARQQLAFYFIGETFILTFAAMLISLGVVEWMLPMLNNFMEKEIAATLFTKADLLLFLLALLLVVTFLAGLYPAMILSGYSPLVVLKTRMTSSKSTGGSVRKILVAFQFVIAQALIIGTLVVSGQMAFFRTQPLGFNKDAIINVDMPSRKMQLMQTFRERLMTNPDIQGVSYSIGAPITQNTIGSGMRLTEGDAQQRYDAYIKTADEHYFETYGLNIVAGRAITEADAKLVTEDPGGSSQYVLVVNESAVRKLGFQSPEQILGKYVTVGLNDISAPVIGVVKDFHIASMHSEIEPLVIMNFPYFYFDAGIKVNSTNLRQTISFIEKEWTALNPDYYFRHSFLDDSIAKLYRVEERTYTLFKVFAGISIFIGCLGLYGLISFMANQKLKEVGVRKVLGASVASIVVLFSKEFVKLILIAFMIAAPVSWFVMNRWLGTFAYRIDIHWSVFVIGVVSTIIIALLTVGYRATKAAFTNPASTLRTE